MTTRVRPVDHGAARARAILAELSTELRGARLDRGLSQADVGRSVGMSGNWVSRIERGLAPQLTIRQASLLMAAIGLELSARAYPAGEPVRDAAHGALLGRFRSRLHGSLRWATEVPLPRPGDLRAWDAQIRGDDWLVAVEAETRPRDLQALKRRLALKLRDGGVDCLVLLLLDSRYNRSLVRTQADALADLFPLSGRRALELLAAGVAPGANAVVLL